jgi:nitric oxide reductase subunit B
LDLIRPAEGFSMKRKWIACALVVGASFVVLLGVGVRIYQEAPPIAHEIVTPDGHLVISGADIEAGQNVWQSMGGMEMGSIWGHGSYVAPDWTADSLHRELVVVLNGWARQESATGYEALPSERQAALRDRLTSMIFLAGGIIGTLHHLYFSGTPTFVLGLGSVFSALEVVP